MGFSEHRVHSFDDRVVYMKVNMLNGTKELHDRLIDNIMKIYFVFRVYSRINKITK